MKEIHIQEHSSPIKNWKQLLVVGVLAFVVPVFLIIAIVQIVMGGLKVDPGSAAMSEEAIAARLKPVGEVRLTLGETPAAAAPSVAGAQLAAAAPAAQPAATTRSGSEVYQQACAMCHATGLAGAPKTGDVAAWKARIAQGVPTLHNHAVNGIRTMPAKGGNPSLSDAEVKAAVDYLVAQAK
jgi:cytochrome c5